MRDPIAEVNKVVRLLRRRGLEEEANRLILDYVSATSNFNAPFPTLPYRKSKHYLLLKGRIRGILFNNGYMSLR